MIRAVTLQDTSAITAIYNEYIAHSTSTFDIEPVSEEEMQKRISEISARYPYFVYETDGEIINFRPIQSIQSCKCLFISIF